METRRTMTYLFSSARYSFVLNHFQVLPRLFYSFLKLEKVQLAIRANRNSNEMENYLCPFPTFESSHDVRYPKNFEWSRLFPRSGMLILGIRYGPYLCSFERTVDKALEIFNIFHGQTTKCKIVCDIRLMQNNIQIERSIIYLIITSKALVTSHKVLSRF